MDTPHAYSLQIKYSVHCTEPCTLHTVQCTVHCMAKKAIFVTIFIAVVVVVVLWWWWW